jgi:hypothetical protein
VRQGRHTEYQRPPVLMLRLMMLIEIDDGLEHHFDLLKLGTACGVASDNSEAVSQW